MKLTQGGRSMSGRASVLARVLGVGLSLAVQLPALAWGPGGHQQVADLAWEGLNAKARSEVKAILLRADEYYQPGDPSNEYSLRAAFRRASLFADSIKGDDFETIQEKLIQAEISAHSFEHEPWVSDSEKKRLKTWHYYDTPLFTSSSTPANTISKSNALAAMKRATAELKRIQSKFNKSDQDRQDQAFWLAWIEHLVGDLHQPLHCAQSFKYRKTEGDGGGNLFSILDPEKLDSDGDKIKLSLHSFWDAGIDRAKDREKSKGQPSSYTKVSARWIKEQKIAQDSAEALNTDVESWIRAGADLAKNVVYKDIWRYSEPDDDYLDAQYATVKRQAVLGGRRLSAILNSILGQ